MGADWRNLCKAADLRVEGDMVEISFEDLRRHKVKVRDEEDHLLLTAIVARRASLLDTTDPEILAWTRNRTSSLVGYRVDSGGRFLGECWVPKVGLDADELQLYLRKLAADCDRMEHVITGEDVE